MQILPNHIIEFEPRPDADDATYGRGDHGSEGEVTTAPEQGYGTADSGAEEEADPDKCLTFHLALTIADLANA